MATRPIVSVIMPVYNAKKYVSAAVDSILGQSFADLELIIVDDCSTDGSWELVSKIRDPRVKVLRQASNMGYPHAMNLGLSVARGVYMARMDADDVSEPERLATQVSFLEEHNEFSFVGTRWYTLTPNGRVIMPVPMEQKYLVEDWEDVLSYTRHFADPSVVVPLDLVKRVGGYRTYQRSGQDVDLWLRILELEKPMATLTAPLYGHRLLPGSIVFSIDAATANRVPRMLAEERRVMGSDSVMRGEPLSVESNLQKMREKKNDSKQRSRVFWVTATRCASAGDISGSWLFAKEAIRRRGLTPQSVKWIAKYVLVLAKAIFGES